MMRQVALTQILAQAGSFVPASSAELSLCDRIFTRVGASDDLAEGRSTFMVEMTETAHILKNATPRSLLLLDEIGRGTATYDGLSLAWSVAEYLHDEVGARTLFATHYHELCDLSLTLDRLKNVHVVVKEWNDQIIFTRTLAEGGAERSYGIQVARLAGLPAAVLARARAVLAELEGDAVVEDDGEPRASLPLKLRRKAKKDQMDLFGLRNDDAPKDPAVELLEQLMDVDVNRLTPIAALNKLDEIVRAAKRTRKRDEVR
jgi:DNA mismatch repair protein MutS